MLRSEPKSPRSEKTGAFQWSLGHIDPRCVFRVGSEDAGLGGGTGCEVLVRLLSGTPLPFRQTAARRGGLEAAGKGVGVWQGPRSGHAAPDLPKKASGGTCRAGACAAVWRRRRKRRNQKTQRKRATFSTESGRWPHKNRPFFGSAMGGRGC